MYDVCQALWHLSKSGTDGEVYNLVDKNDTSKSPCQVSDREDHVQRSNANGVLLGIDQAKINAILEEIFHIKTGFIGKLVSNLARVRAPMNVQTTACTSAGDHDVLWLCGSFVVGATE